MTVGEGGAEMSAGPGDAPPDGVEGLLQRAADLHNQGQLEAAGRLYAQCARRAAHVQATSLYLMGRIAGQSGRPQEGVALIERAIGIDSTRPEFHRDLAKQLATLGQLDAALARADEAIRLQPQDAETHCDRGVTLANLERFDEAIASYDRAAALDPQQAETYNNRGLTLHLMGRPMAAIADFDRAIALNPDMPMAHYNCGRSLLLTGRIDAGLREFEWRTRCPTLAGYRPLPRPVWLGGEPLEGRTIFVYPELFAGDLIQFCRYAPMLEARGARVILAAPDRMHRLLRGLSPTIELVAADANPTDIDIDFHCPLFSLPLALGTTLESIPARTPYLAAEPDRVERWRRVIGEQGFRIGICWQGSTLPYATRLQRSFPLTQFAAIARRPGVRLISLQRHDGLDQLSRLPAGMAVETLGEDFDAGPDAFLDAAAAMASLDLVISVDTSIAHLAGALARPTWVPLPYLPDWRWMLDRADSPWYPSLRLFRQDSPGDWPGAFSKVEAALALELDERIGRISR